MLRLVPMLWAVAFALLFVLAEALVLSVWHP
jgi:hypothetical protein